MTDHRLTADVFALRAASASRSFFHYRSDPDISFRMDVFSDIMAFSVLGTGLLLTVRLRGFQFTHLLRSIASVKRSPNKTGKGEVTAFQAMATALGGSIGTANIAGVAGAIITGGPGAVFWMWMVALLGMAVKCCEIALAVRYRGGAMICIERGMGKRTRPLAVLFAVFGSLAGLVGTALVQSNTIALSVFDVTLGFVPEAPRTAVLLSAGVLTAALTGIVIFGGAKRVGRFSEMAVPFMAAVYIIVSLSVIFMNRERLFPALGTIFSSAFGIKPAAGAVCGMGVRKAFRVGVARGVYSNEAGVGSAPMAHANSADTDPVRQGMLGIFEVFIDTLVVCTLTALVILTSGIEIPYGSTELSGTTLAGSAFEALLGPRIAPVFLSVLITLFAFTSVIGWEVCGESCIKYLFGKKSLIPYRIIYVLLIPVGALVNVNTVWRIGESLNYLMAIPNLIMLVCLSDQAKKEIVEYTAIYR